MATTESVKLEENNASLATKNEAIATHLKAAAKHCLDAANQHEAGDHENAALNTFIAKRHIGLAHQDKDAHGEQTYFTK